MGRLNHSTTYRMQPNGHELVTVRSVKSDTAGGGSGFPEPYDLEDFEDDGVSAVTFTIKRCMHQVGIPLYGAITTDLPGSGDYGNWDVYVKIDTSDAYTPVAIVAYEQGTAIPEAATESGKYFFWARYAIGYNTDGDMAVIADLRKSSVPLWT